MKKMLSMLVALAMLLTLAAPALAEQADVVGTWTVTDVEISGVTVDAAAAGMQMTMTLGEDGAAALDDGSAVQTGTWSFDGETLSLVDETGDEMLLALQTDGTLLLDADGMVIVWEMDAVQSGGEAADSDNLVTSDDAAAAGEAAASPDASDDVTPVGTWVLESVDAAGETLTPADAGLEMSVTFNADGTATWVTDGVAAECSWMQDGAVVSAIDPAAEPAQVSEFTLQADGTMTLEQADGMRLTFVPGEPAAAQAGAQLTYAFSIPDGWLQVTDQTLTEIVESDGMESASVLAVALATIQASGGTLYVGESLQTQMNVVAQPAAGMTFDDLRDQEALLAQQIPGFEFGEPVQYGETTFLPAENAINAQYYAIVDDVGYCFTMTNVLDGDVEFILSSFAVGA